MMPEPGNVTRETLNTIVRTAPQSGAVRRCAETLAQPESSIAVSSSNTVDVRRIYEARARHLRAHSGTLPDGVEQFVDALSRYSCDVLIVASIRNARTNAGLFFSPDGEFVGCIVNDIPEFGEDDIRRMELGMLPENGRT